MEQLNKDQVKARADIVQIIRSFGVELKLVGKELIGHSPLRDDDDTPSFSVNPEKQVWIDRGTGQGGDVFNFVMLKEDVGFQQAFEIVAQKVGLAAPRTTANGHGRRRASEKARDSNTQKLVLAEVIRAELARKGYHVKAEYNFGNHLRKVRFEHTSEIQLDKGRPVKTCRWEHRRDGRWYVGDGDLPKTIYVNKLFLERDQLGMVLGLEGEQKADLAGELGFPAFSYSAGLTPENVGALADIDVVLWPDNDVSGKGLMDRATNVLARHSRARSLSLLVFQDHIPPKGDIVDAVEKLGWDKTRIERAISEAKPILLPSSSTKLSPKRVCDRSTKTNPTDDSGRAQPEISIFTLAELRAAAIKAPTPIVENLLHESDTILLVGKPKVGKSRLVQQLTISLSRGESFLGHRVPRPCRVLLLDLENRPAGAQNRFAKMSQAHDADSNVFIYAPETLSANQVNIASETGRTNLKRLVSYYNPDVLIIDTWRLLVGGDENKTEVIVQAFKKLSEIRKRKPGLATILVHHLRKQQAELRSKLRIDPSAWVESCSGHYSLIGHSDACYGLEREIDKEGNELIVFGGVARNTSPRTVLLEDDPDTLLFTVASGPEPLRQTLTKKEQEIWGKAQSLGAFTFTELQNAVDTKNKKALSAALRKAQSVGMLTKSSDGTYEVASA